MIEICRSHLVAAFPSAMDCLNLCSVREYGRFVTFCDESKTKVVWTVKNGCVQVGRRFFGSMKFRRHFFTPIQFKSIYPKSGDRSLNPSIQMWRSRRQTNAIFGVGFVLLSGTRAACFPRIDAGATDVYRFTRGRARTRVGHWFGKQRREIGWIFVLKMQ